MTEAVEGHAQQERDQSDLHKLITEKMTQPMTPSQLTRRIGMPLRTCSRIVNEMSLYGLTRCLTPGARRNRVYCLTESNPPHIPWEIYTACCFRHRAAVILSLNEPRRITNVKSVIHQSNPAIRISTNNISDIMRDLRALGVVEVYEGEPWNYYFLTVLGKRIRGLLEGARQ